MNLFCRHKWKTLATNIAKRYDDESSKLPFRVWKVIDQQCEKCGKQILRRYKIQ